MVDEAIPDDLKEFILRNLDTIAQLEALLLLFRGSQQSWDASSLCKRLYITEIETEDILKQLAAAGFLVSESGAYRFDAECEHRDMVMRVAEAYSKHLIPITRLIHTKPSRIREFAEAFRLRRES